MPLYDYKCLQCGAVREVLVNRNSTAPVLCIHSKTRVVMERQFPDRSSFVIHGYSQANNYEGKTVTKRTINGIKTEVTSY